MKTLFAIAALLLAGALVGTELLLPKRISHDPIIYWTTDSNPARVEQVRLFEEWLEKNHYGRVKLLLDTANRDMSKQIIQGVSGVAGDVLDLSGTQVQFYHEVGLLTDVTDPAKADGFDPSHTYPAVRPMIVVDGRQYTFPCNVSTTLYFINLDTFRELGQEPPPMVMTIEEFEKAGKEFIAKANLPGERQTRFFADTVNRTNLRRSLGLSEFNETLTACTLDDPRNVQVLALAKKWIFEDRILPSAADMASVTVQSGYGGASLQLFNEGNFGLLLGGRHAVIQLRKFAKPPQLGICEPPNGGFRNVLVGTRCAGVYKASRNTEAAERFLQFLASEEYNMQIVRDGDSLPPVPKYTLTEEYLRPKDHPNEWGTHEAFAKTAETIGIASTLSPFVLPSISDRIEQQQYEAVIAGLATPEQAAQNMASQINQEIIRTLRRRPEAKVEYERRVKLQKEIEQRRLEGRKVPADWISDPFYRKFYEEKGWLE